ncbi:MAG: hypothetical protein ACM3ST_09560 [Bdellovibrio bacteriovorus]
MKFSQVPLGQRLIYQGEPYVKVGPLTARREQDAETRLIPRSALVSFPPTGFPAVSGVGAPGLPEPIRKALDAYEGALRSALYPPGEGDGDLAARLDGVLVIARGAFLDALAGAAETT